MMSLDSHHGKHGTGILLAALRDVSVMSEFGDADWDLLLRVARRTRLTARLASLVAGSDAIEKVPVKVRDHFAAAQVFVDYHQNAARWEINRILEALHGSDQPLVLLKGCAYILAGLPPARGRLLSDVDLLVSAESLGHVEKTLLDHGWQGTKLEQYDQFYYRTWMHELPPMRHPERGFEVDIHHTISPLTSRFKPDPDRLLRESIPLEDARLRVLQPVDMVLHSAVHLFYDGEFINGLRDLVDLADLFGHFGTRRGFWKELQQRARVQSLQRPLFYAMRYTQNLLGADIPADAQADIRPAGPSHLVLALMDWLICRVMVPDHPDFPQRTTSLAQWLLYVRSHWLRMPPGLLIRHLARKQIMRWKHRKQVSASTIPQ